jgi:hypothetical protein
MLIRYLLGGLKGMFDGITDAASMDEMGLLYYWLPCYQFGLMGLMLFILFSGYTSLPPMVVLMAASGNIVA